MKFVRLFWLSLLLPAIQSAAQAPKLLNPPTITVWVASNAAPSAKINLTINTRNVPVVKVAAYRIDSEAWLSHAADNKRKPPTPIGRAVATWNSKLSPAATRPADPKRDTYYSRETRVPKLAPGAYLIFASSAAIRAGSPHASAVINVTDLAVVVKRSTGHMLVWVTDARHGQAVSGARVGVYGRKGESQTSAITATDGSAFIRVPPGIPTVVVSHGRDFAGIGANAANPDGRLMAHFETDRPIYRPGQTVFFKTILRRTSGQGYGVDADAPCHVALMDPKDTPVDGLDLTSNAMGSIHGQFALPTEGMTGAYSLVVTTRNDRAYQTVTVAEYRKPQFKVEVVPTERHFLAGETASFRVNATYYFGAPVQQAAVRYSIRWGASPLSISISHRRWRRSANGNLYPEDTYSFNRFASENTLYTDEHGQLTIPFKTEADAPDAVYSIELTVIDQTRQQVAGSGSVPVYSAAIRLGLSTQLGYAMLGDQIPIDVEARDLDDHPAGAPVDLTLTHLVWDEKQKKEVERVLTKRTVQVPSTGRLRTNVSALAEGELTLRATAGDGTGRTAKASMEIWVAGPYEKPDKEVEEPSITIRLDRATYAPGDLVKAYVTTNRPKAPLMITVEGGDVWQHAVIQKPKTGQRFEFRATSGMSPNAFISGSQWVENRLVTTEEDIPVPNPANVLHVDVKPDKADYRPGDTAKFTVSTSNQSGAPAAAEVALSVVDEAIYALSPDATADMYAFFWSLRANQVSTFLSNPIEMAGGAYQRVSTVAPLRERFEDTAFWTADMATGPSGIGSATFEMPGNLTTWRATARGVTLATSVGGATAMVKANRATMLRLAAPRQIVQGDRMTLIGTVDNRTQDAHEYDVSLKGEGAVVYGAASTHIRLEAGKQATVTWEIDASTLPADGQCALIGEAVATDVALADRPDYSDAVEAKFPVAPKGVRERLVQGGSFSADGSAVLTLPTDRIEPAATVKVRVWHGLEAAMRASAEQIMSGGRWGPVGAANQLIVAADTGLKPRDVAVREALALISRTQRGDGWGWWDEAPATPQITARVLSALSAAHGAHLDTYTNLVRAGQVAAEQRYNQTNLWEDRAVLAAALQASEPDVIDARIEEVLRRADHLSPYAKLRLAETMVRLQPDQAKALAADAVKDASEGPDTAFIPTGEPLGWTVSDTETTAQALTTLVRTGFKPELQQKLARWLVTPAERGWHSNDDNAAIVHALSLYVSQHPEPPSLGDVDLSVNGSAVPTEHEKMNDAVTALIPRELLRSGPNQLKFHRSTGGEAFYTIDASVYRPLSGETVAGVRILRRFEVRNDAGVWVELKRAVHPGEPLRCTVLAWGDDIPDAVRITEPIPAGFELVDNESSYQGHVEERDAAVIHYLVNSGNPVTFRYYIRAESEGKLTALPATAEYIRRPADHGTSRWETLEVRAG